MEPNDSNMAILTRDHNLYNLIKRKTCFKNRNMAVVLVLILTNKKHSLI